MKNQIGIIGLGTMGKALATNLLNNGFSVSGYNRTYSVAEQLKQEQSDKQFQAYSTLDSLIQSLESPRKIIVMVPSGNAIKEMINTLVPLLDKGDIIIDCGNSFYQDTMEIHDNLKTQGIIFYGVGVSGGEKGALLGPSIMPGGDKDYYDKVAVFLEKIAAKKNGEPCCTYIGANGAGHYVKMVHNGIEYADMQIIAEIYLIFKNVLKLSNMEISKIFADWNDTEVGSYLVEITSKILLEKDPNTSKDMVDMIADHASQKGTGKWTTINAAELSQNVSSIQSAVENRIMSGLREERKIFLQEINPNRLGITISNPSIDEIRKAYFLSKLVAYAQGFSLMAEASEIYSWNLNLSKIASIFRAGCIIQAKLLETIMQVYRHHSELKNFLLAPSMLKITNESLSNLRHLNLVASLNEVPNPVLSSALIYLDQLKSPSVGANLIQAQRDYFGAHTFTRIDTGEVVHHVWKNQ